MSERHPDALTRDTTTARGAILTAQKALENAQFWHATGRVRFPSLSGLPETDPGVQNTRNYRLACQKLGDAIRAADEAVLAIECDDARAVFAEHVMAAVLEAKKIGVWACVPRCYEDTIGPIVVEE